MPDTKKMRNCSYLLPDPGGEVLRGLIDDYESLEAENKRLREAIASTCQAWDKFFGTVEGQDINEYDALEDAIQTMRSAAAADSVTGGTR